MKEKQKLPKLSDKDLEALVKGARIACASDADDFIDRVFSEENMKNLPPKVDPKLLDEAN